MRAAALLLLVACVHEPRVPPAPPAHASERDLREGGPHALCQQLALSPCARLDCPACESRRTTSAGCATAAVAALGAVLVASAAGAHQNDAAYAQGGCAGTAPIDDCRRQCAACAIAVDRCGG